jgi:hypothetical protein
MTAAPACGTNAIPPQRQCANNAPDSPLSAVLHSSATPPYGSPHTLRHCHVTRTV